jgi:hypothetical protein
MIHFKDRDPTFQKIWEFTNKAREQAVQKRKWNHVEKVQRTAAEAREALNQSRQGKMIQIVRSVTTLHTAMDYADNGKMYTICQLCGDLYPCEELRVMTDIIDGVEREDNDSANTQQS